MISHTKGNKIRLLLVDDHEVVRKGLRMLLEDQEDMEIIGESSTGANALQLAQELLPNVILLDITLPDLSGIEVTRELIQRDPQSKIIALTIHEDEQFFFEMLRAGASGYVPKRAAPDDLISAIRVVHRDEIYIYPALAKLLVKDFLQRVDEEEATKETIDGLTPREYEILVELAGGASNEEIAEKFTISKHTVARHRENLMQKLQLHNRSELVKYAIRKGLINP